MLSKEALFSFEKNPKINEISIKLLSDYYESYLNPYIYEYTIKFELNNKEVEEIIKLKFDKKRFCHLLGIETIVKKNKNFEEIKEFKGIKGWENIKNDIITIAELKKINKSIFKSNKDKFVFFYLIPKILEKPMIKFYDKEKVTPRTSIESKFIIYDENLNAFIHLALDKEEDSDYYYPRSFFIERTSGNENFKDKYIENQKEVILSNYKKSLDSVCNQC